MEHESPHRRRGADSHQQQQPSRTTVDGYEELSHQGSPLRGNAAGASETPPQDYKSMEETANQDESHTRSLVKGLTWRIVATSTTTVIAWIVTGKVDAALQIGAFEFVAKLLIYYIHERIWTRINL